MGEMSAPIYCGRARLNGQDQKYIKWQEICITALQPQNVGDSVHEFWDSAACQANPCLNPIANKNPCLNNKNPAHHPASPFRPCVTSALPARIPYTKHRPPLKQIARTMAYFIVWSILSLDLALIYIQKKQLCLRKSNWPARLQTLRPDPRRDQNCRGV